MKVVHLPDGSVAGVIVIKAALNVGKPSASREVAFQNDSISSVIPTIESGEDSRYW